MALLELITLVCLKLSPYYIIMVRVHIFVRRTGIPALVLCEVQMKFTRIKGAWQNKYDTY